MRITFKKKSIPVFEGINNETEHVGYRQEYEPVYPEGWKGIEAKHPGAIVRFINGYWDLESMAEDGDECAALTLNQLKEEAAKIAQVITTIDPTSRIRTFVLYKPEHIKDLEKIAWGDEK